ncbi:unnamed protein product [Phytophthora lilii]|uniref:Unnamed protein product n=1 Tax=Phytophthora lilii TaxID=2077276 RepID=A0A9W6TUZ8_9STRA|nr:unnamed protein product [Phytophthora lilii]
MSTSDVLLRKCSKPKSRDILSPRAKYTESMEVMNDLDTIMQSMGSPKYKGMLSALNKFRDQAAAAIVPRLVSNNSGGNTANAEASICFGEEDASVTSSKMFDNEDQTLRSIKITITVTGTQLSTMGQYYEINRSIKVVKDTMDWILALPPFDAFAIPGGFDEFVASSKVLRPLARCTIEN